MFLAGRLQKPVRFIGGDGTLAKLNEYNLHSAMVVAVLLLNTSNFTKTALYETITSLSYLGDPRMSVGGENPNKVRNIVSKQYDRFDRIYGPVLNGLKSRQLLQIDEPAGQIRVTIGSHSRHELLLQLPKHFRSVLQSNSGQTLAQLAQSPQLQHQMAQALRKTVSYPAVVQSAKGLITAGIYKSISYLIQKRIKYLRG
ncbi:mitochondrial matrix Mmp37 [Yamadazyma tenuis ATCC 10573]|nr:mitochondrial matrix Mmp37 [Yamadazyma tenuis ATCC 10573]EGV63408.1 mitochondrial matrix Mmp37 [Yamadazyma tenuis ATCC 10573]